MLQENTAVLCISQDKIDFKDRRGIIIMLSKRLHKTLLCSILWVHDKKFWHAIRAIRPSSIGDSLRSRYDNLLRC